MHAKALTGEITQCLRFVLEEKRAAEEEIGEKVERVEGAEGSQRQP